jgi:hypothetical protein
MEVLTMTNNNERLFAVVMPETGATYEEAVMMAEVDCTLEEAQDIIECKNERQALLAELTRNGMETWEAEIIAEEMAHGLVYAQ